MIPLVLLNACHETHGKRPSHPSSAAAKTTTASLGSDLGLEPPMYWLAYLPAYSLGALAWCSWFDNKGSNSAIFLVKMVMGDRCERNASGIFVVFILEHTVLWVNAEMPVFGSLKSTCLESDCQTVFWEARETEKLICVNCYFTILNDWPNLGATPTSHLYSPFVAKRLFTKVWGWQLQPVQPKFRHVFIIAAVATWTIRVHVLLVVLLIVPTATASCANFCFWVYF